MQPLSAFLLAALLVGSGPALSAGNAGSPEARERFERERARCLAGASQQDRATCLREAGAALQEAPRGGLATPQGNLPENAIARCDAQPAADRAACIARVQGAGKTEGSVEGGGLIRKTETKVQ